MWDGVKGAELHLRYMSIGSSANLVIREKNRLVYFWAMTHTSVLKCRAFCMSLFHLALFLHLCLCLTTSLSLPRLSVSLALCLVVFLSLSFLLNVPPVCLSLSVLHPSLFPCLTLCLSHSFFFFYTSLSLFLSISHPCLWQWWSSGSSVWALNGFCCIFLLNSHRHETSLTQREGWQTDDREDWALSFFLFFSSVCVCVCDISLWLYTVLHDVIRYHPISAVYKSPRVCGMFHLHSRGPRQNISTAGILRFAPPPLFIRIISTVLLTP